MKKQLLNWFLSSGVDYSPLYAYFDNAINIADKTPVFTDVARTTAANDGDYVKSITERIGNLHLSWISSASRRSFLDQEHASRYDIVNPVFKSPSGDRPHLYFPNMLDTQFQSSSFTAKNSPNTSVYIIRNRRSVQDEGGLTFGVQLRDIGYDHYRVINSAGQVDLDAASGIGTFQVIDVLLVEDNGTSTRAFLNNVQLGTNKTLTAGSITNLYYGTNSHQWEHDLLFAGNKYGIFSSGQRSAIQTLAGSLFPVGGRPQAPHLYDPVIAFDGTDTFTITSVQWYDPSGLSENTSLREYEWFLTDNTVSSLQGWTGLDVQHVVSRNSTLKRSEIPAKFNGRSGAGTLNVAVRVKGYNTNGVGYNGIPFRSRYLIDNVAGTPVSTGQVWINSVAVEDATPTIIDIGLTSTAGGGTYSGGNVNHFHVWKNGIEISKTIDLTDLATGVVHLELAAPLTYSDIVTVTHTPDATTPLKNSLNFIVPLMTTGVYIEFQNNIVGPITMKVNLTFGVNATSPPWQNVDTNGTVATIDADVADINGNATGIALAVTNAFQGYSGSGYGSAGTLFNEANITNRGPHVWQGGDSSGTIRFSGLTAGQSFDISYAVALTSNGGAGNVVINGGSAIAFDSSSYAEFTRTGLTADGSGNVDLTITITASGKEAALLGVILTTYP